MRREIEGSIIGFCVGDAVGVPVEFVDRYSLKMKPVTDMRALGSHGQPKGTWSDDSSLVLCSMESLLEGYNIVNLANSFLSWLEKGHWSARGKVFDIGFTTIEALKRVKRGVYPLEAGNKTAFDNGNGSLMRILPFIFYLNNEEDSFKKFTTVSEVSAITHGHIISKIACSIYVEFGINILRGFSLSDSYENTKKVILASYDNNPDSELDKFSRILKDNIKDLQENEIKSTGYVLDTLEAVLWCLLNSKSYEEAVLKGVNLGEDTDTIAALIGGIAGMYYGLEAIPEDWVESLARNEEIFSLCNDFSEKLFLK
jgi:ADP-ribosyl-[dinitrogen reductase] hydrolase